MEAFMSDIPLDLLYSEDHEYVKRTRNDDSVFYVGITDFAQGELGDIVYVDLPDEGDRFSRREVFGTIEAVKAVSDLYCPVGGEVVEVNSMLVDDPSLVNTDPYGKGWLIKLQVDDLSELDELLGADEYEAHIGKGA
jgi:glycine cleavage system H protein